MGLLQKARQEMGSLGCICLQGSPRHRAWGRGASYPKTLLIFLGSSPWGQRVVSGNGGVVGAKTLEGKKKKRADQLSPGPPPPARYPVGGWLPGEVAQA